MADSNQPSAKRLEIKKYPNRRYYDATHSRHLTLDEIRTLIREGYDIRVVDAKTSADITAQVLAQIILELETSKLDSFPVPLLVRLIRVNDQLTKDFIDKYFNQAFQSFLDYQKQFEEQIRQAHGLAGGYPSFTAWTESMMRPFTTAFTGAPPPSEAPPPPKSSGPSSEETLALLQMIKDLQTQLTELKSGSTAARGKAKTHSAKVSRKKAGASRSSGSGRSPK